MVYPAASTSTERAHIAKLAQQAEDVGVRFLNEFPSQDAKDGQYSVIVDAMFGFSFSADRGMSPPYDAILSDLITTAKADQGTKIVSVDVPTSWDADKGDVLVTGFNPDVLISLTAPKLCAKDFTGKHYVGGRFLSPTLSKKYGVRVRASDALSLYILCKYAAIVLLTRCMCSFIHSSWSHNISFSVLHYLPSNIRCRPTLACLKSWRSLRLHLSMELEEQLTA